LSIIRKERGERRKEGVPVSLGLLEVMDQPFSFGS